ncbi:GlgB N-terminal domain-containing protein, partial [Streptomyces sp. NPDC001020]
MLADRGVPSGPCVAARRTARATPRRRAGTHGRNTGCCARTRRTAPCTRSCTRPATAPTGYTCRWRRSHASPNAPAQEADTVTLPSATQPPLSSAGLDIPGPAPAAPVDRERLLAGTHHDPHAVLGAHLVPGGVVFRALRPSALSVTVVMGEAWAELHDDGDGFFSGLLPLPEVPEYRLLVAYEETVQDTEDAYRFLPTLGSLDLHLIGEGRHEELWRALGARVMTHAGVEGVRFTVWAPNAQGVRVCGDFCHWDGLGHPMRSLGSTGVWELFVPGIGAGELYK